MRIKLHILLPLLILLFSQSFASQAEHLFNKGNKFYENKEFDSSVIYYEKSIDQGVKNSALYYNLANAYYRTNQSGKAILNYERAHKLNPLDADIEANLKYAQMNITDRIPEPEKTILTTFLNYLHNLISLKHQLIIIVSLLFIISICFSISLYIKGNKRLWLIYTAVLSTMLLSTIVVSAGIKIFTLENKEFAIVLEERVDAVNAPNGSKTLFSVHEGTKFQIIKKEKNWFYVSLANGVSGWVKSDILEKI